MAGQASILDDNFVVNDVNNVARYTCVVQSAADHQCQNATAAGVGGFLGVAQEDKINGLTANIRMLGISYVKVVGPITAGSHLVIGNAQGYVDAANNQPGAQEIVGVALTSSTSSGDLILMAISTGYRIEKKITGTTNATAATQTAYPHGLGYIPNKVALTSRGNGFIYQSQAADATNIYVSGSAASLPFDAYVK